MDTLKDVGKFIGFILLCILSFAFITVAAAHIFMWFDVETSQAYAFGRRWAAFILTAAAFIGFTHWVNVVTYHRSR